MPTLCNLDGSDQESFYSCDSKAPPSEGGDQSVADSGSAPDSAHLPDSEGFTTSASVSEKFIGIKVPGLTYPKSQYSYFPSTSERVAVDALQDAPTSEDSYEGGDFMTFDLDDFTVYKTGGGPLPFE